MGFLLGVSQSLGDPLPHARQLYVDVGNVGLDQGCDGGGNRGDWLGQDGWEVLVELW